MTSQLPAHGTGPGGPRPGYDPDRALNVMLRACEGIANGDPRAAAVLAETFTQFHIEQTKGSEIPGPWRKKPPVEQLDIFDAFGADPQAAPDAHASALTAMPAVTADPLSGVPAQPTGPGSAPQPVTSAQAQAAKQEAMDRVAKNTDPIWAAEARRALLQAALTHAEFTSDEVWDILAASPNPASTHEGKSMGPVMKIAGTQNWAVNSKRTRDSLRGTNNHRPQAIWTSLIHVPQCPGTTGGCRPCATGEDHPGASEAQIAKAVGRIKNWLRDTKVPGYELAHWGLSPALLAELRNQGVL